MSGCIGGDLVYDPGGKVAYKRGPGRCLTQVALGGCGSPCCTMTMEHVHFMAPCCAPDAKLNPSVLEPTKLSELGDVDGGSVWFKRIAGLGAIALGVFLGRR